VKGKENQVRGATRGIPRFADFARNDGLGFFDESNCENVFVRLRIHLCVLAAFSFCLFACSNKPPGTLKIEVSSTPKKGLPELIGRIWRVSDAPYGPASGSIYIFLPNGTLLETSCVETYRVALWSVDKAQPDTLRVVEDRQPAFTATIGEAGANTLHLHRKLLRSAEVQEITLTAIDGEFVCPDLLKN
jgi:hypothetical protein